MRTSIIIALTAGLAIGCDDGISPEERMPEIGTYTYHVVIDRPEAATPDTLDGSVEITLASPDSIRAVFTVPSLPGDTITGRWNVDAFVLTPDHSTWTGNLNHRIWRDGDTIICVLRYQFFPSGGGAPQTEQGECDLTQ